MVAVVEAMKMESSLTAPFRGRIKRVFVGENVHVGAQAPLVALEAIEQPARARRGRTPVLRVLDRLGRRRAQTPAGRTCAGWSGWCSGYDIGADGSGTTIADLHGQCADLLACDPALIPGEHHLLGMFADLRALSRPDRGDRSLGPSSYRARRSTCTRGCARSTPTRRGCHHGS